MSLLTNFTQLKAAPAGVIGETEHFWYRLAPSDGPWIDSQRGSRAFGIRDGKIFLSEDNAKTWQHQADFADAEDILFSCHLKNGNLVFATQRKLYLSTDKLASYREITLKDKDGGDYVPHPLREKEVAGWYFYSLDGNHTFEVQGVGEMMIWGNYCNVRTGPTPPNIYYSVDGGATVKIAYSFGQNPAFQHPDADPNDRTNWVGDPENPVVCRHVHSVSYNPAENAFYACTGDIDRKIGAGLECHWLRGSYDAAGDAWDWQVVVSSDANSRFKSGGINFVDGQVYWVADANGPKTIRETYDRGIFRCDPKDIADKSKHTRIYPAEYEIAAMTIHEKIIVVPEYGNANPCDCGFLFSPDLGQTWCQYDLKEFGDLSGVRVNPPNDEGWFRADLRAKWL
ncbi:MAG: hypothetical protein KDN20_10300, partial [Verrucomicrobiae bacterium]|nr:hypothetical protein [Verrucomicrobiae bacterium]